MLTNTQNTQLRNYALWLKDYERANGDKSKPEYLKVKDGYNALRDLQEREPTFGEKATAVLGGASEMTGIPQTVAGAGSLLEMAGAENVGRAVKEAGYQMGGLSPEGQYNPALVPQREAGRTAGSALMTYPAFAGMARLNTARRGFAPVTPATPNVTRGERLLDPITRSFQTAPGKAAATEAAFVPPVSTATLMAVSADENNPTLRASAEFLAGFGTSLFANRTRALGNVISDGYKSLQGTVKRTFDSMTPEGQRSQAGQALRRVLSEGGEDYAAVIQRLEKGGTGTKLTAAQLSQSPALTSMEKLLAQDARGAFGAKVRGQAQAEIARFENDLQALSNSGDPRLVQIAAQARKKLFDDLIDGKLQKAETEAATAAQNLKNIEGDKATISSRSRTIIDAAIKDARKTEKELWGAVPKSNSMDATSLVNLQKKLVDEGLILRSEKLPPVLQSELNRMSKQVKAAQKSGKPSKVTSGEILTFRSRILGLEQEALADNKFGAANVYRRYANEALEILDGLPGSDNARQFSRSLNDKLTRSIIGDITRRRTSGATPIRDEETLEPLFRGSAERRAGSAEELIEGVTPVERPGAKIDTTNPENMKQLVGEFLNTMAAQTLKDGKINPAALQSFARSNRKLLQDYPQLLSVVQDAVSAKNALKAANKNLPTLRRNINSTILGDLVGVENVDLLVAESLKSTTRKTPVKDLGILARTAKRHSPEAVDGLNGSVINYLMGHKNPGTTFASPLGRNQPSIKDIMISQGLLNKTSAESLSALLDGLQAAKRSATMLSDDTIPVADEAVLGPQNRIVRILAKFIGSALTTNNPLINRNQSLIMAGEGAKTGAETVISNPLLAVRETIKDILLDPQLTRQVLEESKPYKPRAPIAGRADLEDRLNGMFSKYSGVANRYFFGINPGTIRPSATPGIGAGLLAEETEEFAQSPSLRLGR